MPRWWFRAFILRKSKRYSQGQFDAILLFKWDHKFENQESNRENRIILDGHWTVSERFTHSEKVLSLFVRLWLVLSDLKSQIHASNLLWIVQNRQLCRWAVFLRTFVENYNLELELFYLFYIVDCDHSFKIIPNTIYRAVRIHSHISFGNFLQI